MSPSIKEEEYFTRLTLERKRKAEEEKHSRHEAEEKKKIKELHYMHCPKCGMKLSEVDHKDVKIDKCSHCHGVWLDAGELEAILKLDQSVLHAVFDIFRK